MFKTVKGGIVKFGNFSGQVRRQRLQEQAARAGVLPEELLRERKDKMALWQTQRHEMQLVRCSNCGHRGHSFEWCPFALRYFLRQLGRFRGMSGHWRPDEPPLCLTELERSKFNKHFAILSMSLECQPTSDKYHPTPASAH